MEVLFSFINLILTFKLSIIMIFLNISWKLKIWQIFEKLAPVVTILQLERPSDWLSYRYQQSTTLQPTDVAALFSLRIDFSADSIQPVVAALANN